ncbi:hypothetical protein ACLOJK_013431 [Asimina triloba]
MGRPTYRTCLVLYLIFGSSWAAINASSNDSARFFAPGRKKSDRTAAIRPSFCLELIRRVSLSTIHVVDIPSIHRSPAIGTRVRWRLVWTAMLLLHAILTLLFESLPDR